MHEGPVFQKCEGFLRVWNRCISNYFLFYVTQVPLELKSNTTLGPKNGVFVKITKRENFEDESWSGFSSQLHSLILIKIFRIKLLILKWSDKYICAYCLIKTDFNTIHLQWRHKCKQETVSAKSVTYCIVYLIKGTGMRRLTLLRTRYMILCWLYCYVFYILHKYTVHYQNNEIIKVQGIQSAVALA